MIWSGLVCRLCQPPPLRCSMSGMVPDLICGDAMLTGSNTFSRRRRRRLRQEIRAGKKRSFSRWWWHYTLWGWVTLRRWCHHHYLLLWIPPSYVNFANDYVYREPYGGGGGGTGADKQWLKVGNSTLSGSRLIYDTRYGPVSSGLPTSTSSTTVGSGRNGKNKMFINWKCLPDRVEFQKSYTKKMIGTVQQLHWLRNVNPVQHIIETSRAQKEAPTCRHTSITVRLSAARGISVITTSRGFVA